MATHTHTHTYTHTHTNPGTPWSKWPILLSTAGYILAHHLCIKCSYQIEKVTWNPFKSFILGMLKNLLSSDFLTSLVRIRGADMKLTHSYWHLWVALNTFLTISPWIPWLWHHCHFHGDNVQLSPQTWYQLNAKVNIYSRSWNKPFWENRSSAEFSSNLSVTINTFICTTDLHKGLILSCGCRDRPTSYFRPINSPEHSTKIKQPQDF